MTERDDLTRRAEALNAALQALHFYNPKRADEIAEKAGVAKPENPRPLLHAYEPNPKYPWFCRHCGYSEHETMKHDPEMSDRARKRRQARGARDGDV